MPRNSSTAGLMTDQDTPLFEAMPATLMILLVAADLEPTSEMMMSIVARRSRSSGSAGATVADRRSP
jgi:hypothetical protein